MSKSLVSRLFLGSILAVVAGLIFGFIAVIAAYGAGAFVMDGPDVVGVEATPYAWTMVAVAVISLIAIALGALGGLVSWIGALLNTALLAEKTWFVVLLVLGLLSFGFVAMVAYVIAGPDGTREQRPAVGSNVPLRA